MSNDSFDYRDNEEEYYYPSQRKEKKEKDSLKIGCFIFAIVAVIFIIVFLGINGFSLENSLKAITIVDVTFSCIVYAILGLIAVPALTAFYFAIRKDYKDGDKRCSWISPFFSATYFGLLYGLFWILFGWAILKIVNWWVDSETPEFLFRLCSFTISFILFDLLVLLGCLFVKKHPDICLEDFDL